jgi:hypothetical protein
MPTIPIEHPVYKSAKARASTSQLSGDATAPTGGGANGVTVGPPAARESGSLSRVADKQEFQLSYPDTVRSTDLRRFDI